jgi:hypothetical protein
VKGPRDNDIPAADVKLLALRGLGGGGGEVVAAVLDVLGVVGHGGAVDLELVVQVVAQVDGDARVGAGELRAHAGARVRAAPEPAVPHLLDDLVGQAVLGPVVVWDVADRGVGLGRFVSQGSGIGKKRFPWVIEDINKKSKSE